MADRPSFVGPDASRNDVHQSCPVWVMTGASDSMPYIVSITRRTSGAATSEPKPACSTMATTTYFGSFAGTMAANHDVSWN